MRIRPLLSLVVLLAPLAAPAQETPAAPAEHAAHAGRVIAPADAPSREQLVRLFEVMRIRSQMEDMLKMVPAALEQQLRSEQDTVEISLMPLGGELTAEQKAARDRVTKKYLALVGSIYPVDEMLNDMVAVYQRYLSRGDVDGILDFYRSLPGQHLLDAQPLMAKEVMPMVTKKMESRTEDLVKRYRKELNDAMGPPKVAPPPVPKS